MTKHVRQCVAMFAVSAFLAPIVCHAQQWNDQVDPQHFKLEFENDCVRVVRGTFGAGEKSAGMFDTVGVVVVMLTERKAARVLKADGGVLDLPPLPAGSAYWTGSRGKIGLENTSDQTIEYLVVQPKIGCKN